MLLDLQFTFNITMGYQYIEHDQRATINYLDEVLKA